MRVKVLYLRLEGKSCRVLFSNVSSILGLNIASEIMLIYLENDTTIVFKIKIKYYISNIYISDSILTETSFYLYNIFVDYFSIMYQQYGMSMFWKKNFAICNISIYKMINIPWRFVSQDEIVICNFAYKENNTILTCLSKKNYYKAIMNQLHAS